MAQDRGKLSKTLQAQHYELWVLKKQNRTSGFFENEAVRCTQGFKNHWYPICSRESQTNCTKSEGYVLHPLNQKIEILKSGVQTATPERGKIESGLFNSLGFPPLAKPSYLLIAKTKFGFVRK